LLVSKEKKRTGLGKSAFFKNTAEETTPDTTKPAQPVEIPQAEVKEEKPRKVRTTVLLYEETMAGLEELKVHERRAQGKKITYSDILNEAISDLMKKKGLEELAPKA